MDKVLLSVSARDVVNFVFVGIPALFGYFCLAWIVTHRTPKKDASKQE